MIVRVLGEGQFRVDDDTAFRAALGAAVGLVRESGTSVPADTFVTADYILPFSDASVDEVRKLLADGTLPGDSIGHP